jgi:hypothetical protein
VDGVGGLELEEVEGKGGVGMESMERGVRGDLLLGFGFRLRSGFIVGCR